MVPAPTFRDNGRPMRFRELYTTPSGEPRLVLPALVALVLTFVVGFGAMRVVQRTLPLEEQARVLSHTRKLAAAEAIYVRLLRERPTAELVIAFIDNHRLGALLRALGPLAKGAKGLGEGTGFEEGVMSNEAFEELVAHGLSPEHSRLARFWQALPTQSAPDALRAEMKEGAEREPPVRMYNHALARDASGRGELDEAAALHAREGMAFPDRKEDIDAALHLWMRLQAWDKIHERLADPRFAGAASPSIKYEIAVHDRDWKAAASHLVGAWRPHLTLTTGVMSGVAAIAWGFFCARLGNLGKRPVRRSAFYLVSFGLGILSVVPTVLLIAVEEAKLKLVASGDPIRDAIYFVAGVGLREEAAKLLLFAPMLLVLRKWGDKLDVLVCGAMVGLGFAAEENLNYLASGDLRTGLGRFLTANFLHMAMTGILASALDDFLRDTEKQAADFSRTAFMVVGLHGAYDFLLSHEEYGGNYLAMTVFFFLVRMFLSAIEGTRRKPDTGFSLTQSFVVSLGVVTGTSLVYSVAAVGPYRGAIVLAEGLLGVAILVYAFVKSLRWM